MSEYRIRELAASDARSLSNCFRRCYGDTYPARLFYDVHTLENHITSGQLRSVVAVLGAGDIVGHTGLTVRHREALAIEAGNTVVDPACRGSGLLGRLGSALGTLCRETGYVGYVHYPTTAHDIMQKRSVANDGVETGILLDYVPAETDYVDVDQGGGRLAVTVVYQPFAPAPEREVVLPDRYASLLEALYSSSGLNRQRIRAAGGLVASGNYRSTWHPERRLTHWQVDKAGSDLPSALDADSHDPDIVLVDVPLDENSIDEFLKPLTERGFFYAALMPEFGRTDLLRLQWLKTPQPTSLTPSLANPGARALLEFMISDAGLEQLHAI